MDLMKGKCVQLIGGDENRKRLEIDDPIEVAKGFVDQGAKYLHVIDLDRALGNGENQDIMIDIIEQVDVPVQVGGGIRGHEMVDLFLDKGADRVIVGTKAVLEPDWLKKMVSVHPRRMVVAVDTRGDEILIKGWQTGSGKDLIEFAREVDGLKLAGLLFTNVVLEGRLEGTDVSIVKKLVDAVDTPVIAAGGITTMKDLEELKRAGVGAAVLGSAIYEGKIEFKDAVGRFE